MSKTHDGAGRAGKHPGALLLRADTECVSKISLITPSSMMPVSRVAVIGCGLMGGSIAKAARLAGIDVSTYDSDPATVEALKSEGFKVASTPGDACAGRDLVVLCTPVDHIVTVAAQIKPYLEDDTIVTEIGSVKAPVRALIDALKGHRVEVVPTHPMAGSEKSGFQASAASVIAGCTWLMCPEEGSQSAGRLAGFLRTIGAARCLSVSYDAHDAVVAIVSHLPQMVATLTAAVAGEAEETYAKGAFAAAGGGFKDTTRIADSSISMWRPILSANGPLVATLLLDLAERCRSAAEALHCQNLDEIERVFSEGHRARDEWRASQAQNIDALPEAPIEHLARWDDLTTGESAWLDNSMGWETVRTSAADPVTHVNITARFLGAILGAENPVAEVAAGQHHESVAGVLQRAGVEVEPHSTWTADGLPVQGVKTRGSRFIVVI